MALSKKAKDRIFIISMLAWPVIQFAVFFIYVNINTVLMSFQFLDFSTGTISWNTFYYKQFFYELVTMPSMWVGIKNSIYATINSIFVLMPLGVISGYFFFKKIPWGPFFKVVFFIPNIISMIVMSTVFLYMFDTGIGPIAAIMDALGFASKPDFFNDKSMSFLLILLYCNWAGVGYGMLVMSGNINKIPKDLMEYGQLEGIGMFKEVTKIVIPCIWPIIQTQLVTGVMTVFTFFIQVQIITRGNAETQTLAYIINGLVSGQSQNLEKAAAFGLCVTLFAAPILVIVKWLTGKVYQDVEF